MTSHSPSHAITTKSSVPSKSSDFISGSPLPPNIGVRISETQKLAGYNSVHTKCFVQQ